MDADVDTQIGKQTPSRSNRDTLVTNDDSGPGECT